MAKVPAITADNIKAYVQYGHAPGGFLEAVISNDIFAAVSYADLENRRALAEIVLAVKTIPHECKGSRDVMQAWCRHRGLSGKPGK